MVAAQQRHFRGADLRQLRIAEPGVGLGLKQRLLGGVAVRVGLGVTALLVDLCVGNGVRGVLLEFRNHRRLRFGRHFMGLAVLIPAIGLGVGDGVHMLGRRA